MTGSLVDRVRGAVEVSKQLHALTERLNAKLAIVECALSDLGLGVEASASLGHWGTLWFHKRDGAWRLDVQTRSPVGVHLTHVLRVSRETRLLVADALPTLVENLLREVEQHREEVAGRVERLDDVVAKLREASKL